MSEQDDRRPSEMVPFRDAQIIVGALVAGVLMFSVVAFMMTAGKQPQMNAFVYAAVAFTAGDLVASAVVPTATVNKKLREYRENGVNPSVMDLFAQFNLRNILRSALLEGAAFLCLVAYIVTASPWLLGLAWFLAAAIAVGFPTRERFDSWVREQRELISLDQS